MLQIAISNTKNLLPQLKEERQLGRHYKKLYGHFDTWHNKPAHLALGNISRSLYNTMKDKSKTFSSNSFHCRVMPFATERIFLPRLKEERQLDRQCKTFDIDNLTLGIISLGVWHYEAFLATCTTTR